MIKRQTPELVYDNLVIGSSLESVLFSYYTNSKIIWTRNRQPYRIEKIKDFGLGSSKIDIWSQHMFLLGLGGRIPFSDNLLGIRYIDRETISVITAEDSHYKIKFKKLWIFDDYNLYDIPIPTGTRVEKKYVYDIFHIRGVQNYDVNYKFNRDSDFIKNIEFFKKWRAHLCIVESITEDLDKIPDYLVRVKLTEILKNDGFDIQVDSRVEHIERQISDSSINVYKDFDNVHFFEGDLETIYGFREYKNKLTYLKYLKLKLGL